MGTYRPNGAALTPHEREILTILQEEAAEIIVAASKLLRFGKEDNGYGPDKGSNTVELGREVGDLEEMVTRALHLGLFDLASVGEGKVRKRERLLMYLQTEAP